MTYLVRYGNKYGAQSTLYKGIAYHSKKEAGFARDLDLLLKANEIKSWERQFKIELRAPSGELICRYYCDFMVVDKNGQKKLIEIKGFSTEIFRLKLKLLQLLWLPQHPEYEYEIIR